MDGLEIKVMAQELVRALRAHRSQVALSRRLGYRSNVAYLWESGRRDPTASELFRIVDRTGGDPRKAWARFPVSLDDVDLRTAGGIASLIAQLRGGARIGEVARRCGVSRYTASRWLRGTTEPRLSQFLVLVEALTFRLLDFVASLVPPTTLPTLQAPWRELDARRRVAFTHPWSHVLLRQIETLAYRRLSRHSDAWLAKRLGIERDVVNESLDALRTAGLVSWDGKRYQTEPVAVDTSMASMEERRGLRLHWADVGRARIQAGADGYYSWSVFALSREDYEKLRVMHVRYMNALRQLVDQSEPSEVVAIANVQLFMLDES